MPIATASSVIDTINKKKSARSTLGLPIGVPENTCPTFSAGPNPAVVDAKNNIAYVALHNANAIAVVDINNWGSKPVMGMIPVGYAPASVVLDTADNALLVADDKDIGTTGFQKIPPGAPTVTSHRFAGRPRNTHQDLGTAVLPWKKSRPCGG